MIPNIGPAECRKRRTFGLMLLVLSAAIAAVLFATGTHRLWRLVLFLPLWGVALGLLQAQDKT